MIDLRSIRVGIEISGEMRYYQSLDGFKIRVEGHKRANAQQDECAVIISNLKMETRDFLISETSPFNENKEPKLLVVEAGRVSTGLFEVFQGDIVSAEPASPPDVDLTIKAKTGARSARKVISNARGGKVNLSEIAQMVADDIEAGLNFQATDKLIENYTYSGSAYGQINRLATAGNVKAFLDGKTLFVLDRDKATEERKLVLNMGSGMVGIPKATEEAVEVTFLATGDAQIGGVVEIDSQYNKALNGDYKIDQFSYELSSHDDPFFYKAICTRL